MQAVSLNPSTYNFPALASSVGTNAGFVGWSNANPASDVILYDKGLNCLLARDMRLSNGIKVKIELVNKFLFGDLSSYAQSIA
jgi:hypothetical protein